MAALSKLETHNKDTSKKGWGHAAKERREQEDLR